MKELDKKLIETINRYIASGIEQQVDYEKFNFYKYQICGYTVFL